MFNVLNELFLLVESDPYCIPIYVTLSATYLQLGYPDLAAGAAYKALLLCDAIRDEADEYHERAHEALGAAIGRERLEQRVVVLKHVIEGCDKPLSDTEPIAPGEQSIPPNDEEVDAWLETHYQRKM